MEESIEHYFALRGKKLSPVGQKMHRRLVKNGCDFYIKTIYIGYEIGGNMVAAIYAHSDHIEIALALDEDHSEPALKDASHLTWRTLPLSLEVRSLPDSDMAENLIDEACERIEAGTHSVSRDNEHFARSHEVRRDQRGGDQS